MRGIWKIWSLSRSPLKFLPVVFALTSTFVVTLFTCDGSLKPASSSESSPTTRKLADAEFPIDIHKLLTAWLKFLTNASASNHAKVRTQRRLFTMLLSRWLSPIVELALLSLWMLSFVRDCCLLPTIPKDVSFTHSTVCVVLGGIYERHITAAITWRSLWLIKNQRFRITTTASFFRMLCGKKLKDSLYFKIEG